MISGYAVATLVVFIISNLFVIHPVSIPAPRPIPRIQINLGTAPILAIVLLWAAQCLDPAVIRNGIVGTEGVKPYNILIFFLSLAYMTITLDVTGILQAAAFWVSYSGGQNGWKLYIYFYVMFTLLSILLGNDSIILSGTPFLVYYTSAAYLDPTAWVMAEFAAANTASMVLFAGNPTNIVICEGFNIGIAAFTAYTILPFLACHICCFVVLAFQHRNRVPRRLARTARRNPREALLDPVGAWVGSLMLGVMLILCLVVGYFGIDVWMISLPFASGKFLFDLTWEHYRRTHGIPIELGCRPPKADREGLDEGSAVKEQQHLNDTSSYSLAPDAEQSFSSGHRLPKADGKELDEGSTAEKQQQLDHRSAPRAPVMEHSSPFHNGGEITMDHPQTPQTESKTEPQMLFGRGISILRHGVSTLGRGITILGHSLPRVAREALHGPTAVEDIHAKGTLVDQRPEDTSPYSPSLDKERPQSPLSCAEPVVRLRPETLEIIPVDQRLEDTSFFSPSPDRERPWSPLPRAGSVVQSCPETPNVASADQRLEDTLPCSPFPDKGQVHSPLPHAGPVGQSCPPISRTDLEITLPLEAGTEMSCISSRRHSYYSSPTEITEIRRSPSFPHDEVTAVGSLPEIEIPKLVSKSEPRPLSAVGATTRYVLQWYRSYMDEHFPTFTTALSLLPFTLIPFAFSQFILIEALDHQGWVEVFADWLVRTSGNRLHPTIWLIGVLGVILCNLSGTNVGTTILLTKVVHAAALPHDANRAAAIALAVVSNVGTVNLVFSASLVGPVWRAILEKRGVHVRKRDFALWNLLPLLVMTSVGLGIVSAEMAVLYQSP